MTNFITDDLINANIKSEWYLGTGSVGPSTNGGVCDFSVLQSGSVGDWTNSNGSITIQHTGWYRIIFSLGSSGTTFSNMTVVIRLNGVNVRDPFVEAASSNTYQADGTAEIYITEGQVLTITASNDYNVFADYRSVMTISRVAQYSAGEPAGFGLGTPTRVGLVKAGQILQKGDNTNYTTNTNDILDTPNIPAGKYYVTVGYNATRQANDNHVDLWLQLNGSDINSPRNMNLGLGNPGGVTDHSGNVSGMSKSIFLDQSSTFRLAFRLNLGGSSTCDGIYMIVQRLDDNIDVITTEWD
jgi:hypothetical protein